MLNLTQQQDTIVALSTPNGSGAIALVRLSGAAARPIADRLLRSKKSLFSQPSHTAIFGEWVAPDGALIDEVVVTQYIAPRSYTKEDLVEVACHGSSYIIQRILETCLAAGARLAKPGEFTQRAFLNGRLDLSQAEAVADLIAASNKATHQVALRQMRGGMSQQLQTLRDDLIRFAGLLELELDFSEEDVEFANRTELLQTLEQAQAQVEKLMQSFQLGNALKQGVQTVIAGRPNAGKSTLLNALLEEERALVSDIAGTTRDSIEETLVINGVTFRLIDTAGIREATDTVEAMGVARTFAKIQQSAILLYVFDILALSPAEVLADLTPLLTPELKIILVANKMDLNPYATLESYASAHVPPSQIIPIVAAEQRNVPYLKEVIYQTAIGNQLDDNSVIVSNARHYEALRLTQESLQAAANGLQSGITHDWVAIDLRRALHHIGEVTGNISHEDVLDTIFSSFCIGK